ncbi:hypothetical protein [Anaerolinea sp.]|uniref:hypothetical protein n=1 Tax=Anaerolinea sp. TaxID=1872519 RepID=UPI002ACEBC1D|nr:hypothetical protein [Anaerolinea sp.]
MQNTLSQPKPGENYLIWSIKIVSGVLIIAILVIHLLVNHLLAPNGLLSHAEVVAYYRNYPIVPIMEGFFLVFVVVHSLIGLRSIILDLHPKPAFLKVLDFLFVCIGVFATVYGIWLLFAILKFGL